MIAVHMGKYGPAVGFSVADLVAEAQRELDLRRQLCWSRVRAGTMRRTEADRQIALMTAIVRRLTATAAL